MRAHAFRSGLESFRRLNVACYAGRREVVRAMFSGIVEEMGSVSSLIKNDAVRLWDGSVGEGVELTVRAKTVLEGAADGCSIAVNGVCLTVTSFDDTKFKVASLLLVGARVSEVGTPPSFVALDRGRKFIPIDIEIPKRTPQDHHYL